jgi:hydroxyacylglutathione hydrolase
MWPMWFKQLIREETGCATYLVASSETGECLAFDPLWDVEPYRRAADSVGMKITHVVDSHAHADHVSGARRLAAETGARLWIPEQMEADYPADRLCDGDVLRLGEVELEVMHVPGHRPE